MARHQGVFLSVFDSTHPTRRRLKSNTRPVVSLHSTKTPQEPSWKRVKMHGRSSRCRCSLVATASEKRVDLTLVNGTHPDFVTRRPSQYTGDGSWREFP